MVNDMTGLPKYLECLTESQQEALDAAMSMKDGGCLFITGGAGCGKSAVARSIVAMKQATGKNVLVCAPTGLAAMNIDGETIHSAFGFPAEPCIINSGGGLRLRVTSPRLVMMADTVILDEASMIGPDLMDACILSLRKAGKESGRPKTLVLIGDLFQLSPVVTENHRKLLEEFYGTVHENWYPFMGNCWNECDFRIVFLTQNMRQMDKEFVEVLNQARRGDLSCLSYLNEAVRRSLGPGATSLYAYNNKVQEKNRMILESLPGMEYRVRTIFSAEKGHSLEDVRMRSWMPDEISFKEGAQILFTATDYGICAQRLHSGIRKGRGDTSPAFVNGMTGRIEKVLADNSVIIQTDKGSRLKVAPLERPVWEMQVASGKIEKSVVGSAKGYPFMLSYAQTIHRSQGRTLTEVVVDPDTFAPGQLYVALSRVRSMEGLSLTRAILPEDLKVDPSITAFYDRAEKKAGISRKRGRPTSNTDGSRKDIFLWVPKALENHVREEVLLNRVTRIPAGISPVQGRVHLRVTERLYAQLKEQIETWKKQVKEAKKG